MYVHMSDMKEAKIENVLKRKPFVHVDTSRIIIVLWWQTFF